MSSGFHYQSIVWVALAVMTLIVLVRTLWVYRGSANWPVVEGTITGLDVQQIRDADGRYSCATFIYEFQDCEGCQKSGTWHKNFSTDEAAKDFAGRELPIGKQVIVRFNPKNSAINDLELDAFTYTDDRPTSLNL
ncbi:DUF3592 domain-containing protein [Occallatibacter savannae]|uniref:DUF3592 domain-containing protein n=1 Tax=Occallatibacter savannae TaxID=1002691 RepID=UPI000D68B359|nr:DUF3592 domain-containing protein [Occallatibacter savannae]